MFSLNMQGEVSKVESEDIVVYIDVRLSGFPSLVVGGGRGQVEDIIGGPPRHHDSQDFLVKRMLLAWMVAERGARKERLRGPFFALEMPLSHAFWSSPAWTQFNEEYDFPVVEVSSEVGRYVFGTDMDLDGTPLDAALVAGHYTRSLATDCS